MVIVAASDAPQSWKQQAQHICTGSGDQVAIQAAINANPKGVIELSPGTFNCDGDVNLSGGTFKGQGPGVTCIKFTDGGRLNSNSSSGQVISDFRVEGYGYTYPDWQGVVNIQGPNQTIRNVVGWADHTVQTVFFVCSNPAVGHPIYNVEFDNCHADNPRTHGFLHNQWYGSPAQYYTPIGVAEDARHDRDLEVLDRPARVGTDQGVF